jgi:transposase-like protein
MAAGKPRRQRRSFTDEFKAEVIRKIGSSGKTAGQVARELDLTETAVRHWVKQAQADRIKPNKAAEKRQGVHANAAMWVDPHLKNTCFIDRVGGSVSFYDTKVKLVPV